MENPARNAWVQQVRDQPRLLPPLTIPLANRVSIPLHIYFGRRIQPGVAAHSTNSYNCCISYTKCIEAPISFRIVRNLDHRTQSSVLL